MKFLALLLSFVSTITYAQSVKLGNHISFNDNQGVWRKSESKSFLMEGFGRTLFGNQNDSTVFLEFNTIHVPPEQIREHVPDFTGESQQLIELNKQKYNSKLGDLGATSDIKTYKDFWYFEVAIKNDTISYYEIYMLNIYNDSFHTYVNLISSSNSNLKNYVEGIINNLEFKKLNKEALRKEEQKSQELVLFRKIGSGEYEPHEYLKALIFEKYNKDFKRLLKSTEWNIEDVLGEGLIGSVLRTDYKDLQHEISNYFTWLNFKKIGGKMYFYQDSKLRGDKHFFIWGEIQNPNEIEYKSHIVNDIKDFVLDSIYFTDDLIINQSRNLTLIGLNDSNEPWAKIYNDYEGDSVYAARYGSCTFNEDSTVKTTSMSYSPNEKFFPEHFKSVPKEKPITIRADTPEEIKKYFTSEEYRELKAFNDSIITIRNSIWDSIKEDIPRPLRLYISEIKFEDLNKDGNFEFYWFAISNGELISLKVYTFFEGSLNENEDDSLDIIIKESQYFKDYMKMSLMKNSPTI